MTIAMSGKNKIGFVDGSLPRPSGNSTAKAWDRVDHVVMGWIIAVLEDSIANSVLSYKTSKAIWDELGERDGQSSNAQMFSLQEVLNTLTQTSEMTISEFFTKIKTLWDEFDELNPVPSCNCPAASSCTCEIAKKCFKMQQNIKVISFLMKHDKKYKQVKSNMLMMADLPTLAQAYRILLQEETHLQLSSSGKDLNETLACRAEKKKFERGNFKNGGSDNYKAKKQFLYCDHCKINGQSKDKCWKLVGYPTNHKGNTWKRDYNKNINANSAISQDVRNGMINAQFTQVRYQQIIDMLNKQD